MQKWYYISFENIDETLLNYYNDKFFEMIIIIDYNNYLNSKCW